MPINDKRINFVPSPSSDVASYRMYHCLATLPVDEVDSTGTYKVAFIDLGLETSALLSEVVGLVEGTYNLGVTAIDEVGNESSMSIINGVEVDFVAPDPPGAITVTPLSMD